MRLATAIGNTNSTKEEYSSVRMAKKFLEAGKKRLAGDTAREASSGEVKHLRSEAAALKEALAELLIENRLLKKSVIGGGEDAI